MKKDALVVAGFALIVCAGGLVGFVTKGSLPSLISSSAISLGLFLSSFNIQKKQSDLGYLSALLLSLFLLAFFAYRFAGSLSFMPAGLMVVLSFIVSSYLTCTYRRLARQ